MSTAVDMGTPPAGWLKEYTATIHVHNFKDLPTTRLIVSPNFSCSGREWSLVINMKSEPGKVRIYLMHRFDSPSDSYDRLDEK